MDIACYGKSTRAYRVWIRIPWLLATRHIQTEQELRHSTRLESSQQSLAWKRHGKFAHDIYYPILTEKVLDGWRRNQPLWLERLKQYCRLFALSTIRRSQVFPWLLCHHWLLESNNGRKLLAGRPQCGTSRLKDRKPRSCRFLQQTMYASSNFFKISVYSFNQIMR